MARGYTLKMNLLFNPQSEIPKIRVNVNLVDQIQPGGEKSYINLNWRKSHLSTMPYKTITKTIGKLLRVTYALPSDKLQS